MPTPLSRLSRLNSELAKELKFIPDVRDEVLKEPRSEELHPTLPRLLAEIDRYWAATSAQGQARQSLFIAALEQALRDEVALKIDDGTLHLSYASCLPSAIEEVNSYSLHLNFNEQTVVKIAGALVFTTPEGRTLLSVPGFGVEAFPSQALLRDAMTQWTNNIALRNVLLNNAEQRYQTLVSEIDHDADLFLDPFTPDDWQLRPINQRPFEHAFFQQLNKQREDVSHAFGEGMPLSGASEQWPGQVNHAIRMPGLLGPQAMIAQHSMSRLQRSQRQQLPDWFRFAEPQQRQRYVQLVQDYEHSRAALLSLLGGAASPEQFAHVRLRARIANDLGYDLDPQQLIVTTWRALPLTGETYEVSRPLTHLALYGLHPGDEKPGSAFLTRSRFSHHGQPLRDTYRLLTSDYLAQLIGELDVRMTFAPHQRETHGSAQVQQLMRDVSRQQIRVLAYAAWHQGHIQEQDVDFIESARIQQVQLNQRETLSNLLVLRQENPQGQLQRLLLLMPDSPRDRLLQAFDNEQQLHEELISWSAFPEMSDYLIRQVKPVHRNALEQQLAALREKPQPLANFLTLITQPTYDDGLQALVNERIRLAFAEQEQHTPDWYRRARKVQRQELVALEDALFAAHQYYAAKPHTQVPTFEDYVHQRATLKINELLGTPAGTVDPDRIIITSQRERLTFTQLLRDGYDDSVGFISTSAASEARFSGPNGVDLSALTAEKVARSAHGTWLSDDYVALIQRTLLNPDSTGYSYRRQTCLLITQLQMSAAALRSHLKNQISAQQYQWLRLSIEQLHHISPIARQKNPVYALQFRLDNPLIASGLPELGSALDMLADLTAPLTSKVNLTQIETVHGCYVLTPGNTRNPQTALLYTPQAPDGLEWRAFDSFVDTLKHEGMSDYYKDRCRQKANRTLAFFLADMKNGGGSQPPQLPAGPYANLYDVCFNRKIERKIRDVQDTTTGRSDMLAKLVWDSLELIATAVTLPFPPASFAVGALLAFRDSFRALQAFSEGDREAAAGYILASLFNSLGAIGDLDSGLKGFGRVVHQFADPAKKVLTLDSALPLTPPMSDLRPVILQGEPFWTKPTTNAYFPLYQASTRQPDTLLATGHFAKRDASGGLQPLRLENSNPVPDPLQPNPAYAVNLSSGDAIPISSGHAKGVTLAGGQPHIELAGLTFRVQYDPRMACWNIIDPANPFAFFGKQPVQLTDHGQWQLVDPLNLRGGGRPKFNELHEDAAGPSTQVGDFSDYELPASMQPYMHGIVNPTLTDNLTDTELGFETMMRTFYTDMRPTYATLRQNLYRDAHAFFEQAPLASRPTLPLIDTTSSTDNLIKNIFTHSNGLVVGEAPASIASKQWLIDSMPLLVEQKVEILYLEHLLTDQHLDKLSKYKKLGNKTRSGSLNLKTHFDGFNGGALNNSSKVYDYYHLLKTAHQHGIEVKPLNSSVSYPFSSSPVSTAAGDNTAPRKMSTFFGHKVISADTAAKPERRWVALLDQERMNTWQQVPGITELQGAISVRVKDVPAGRATRVSREAAPGSKLTPQGDFTLEMANPNIVDLPGPSSTVVSKAISKLDASLYAALEGRPYVQIRLDPTTGKLVEHWPDMTNPYAGEHGFTLDKAGQWQRVDPSQWNADTSMTPLQQSLIDLEYDMPLEFRTDLHELAKLQHRGLNQLYQISDAHQEQARRALLNLRQQLQNNARRVISGDLPPRPTLPDVAPETTAADFFDTLYEHSSAVIIGESHSSVGSKKLIIDNLPHLAQQQVKTLYMEHLLTDLHQMDLDRFTDTGQMSKRLLHDLRQMDLGHRTDPKKVYTFENLVIKAREHGLEVRAIDCAASYHLSGMLTETSTTREQMMNYFASRTIRKHQEVVGAHKWIALMGNAHVNTYQKIVPGVAELEGGIGIRVLDVGPGQARVTRDPGENVLRHLSTEHAFLKSDYRLDMQTLETPVARRPMIEPVTLSVEDRLQRPGLFLIDTSEDGTSIIVHRSRDNSVHRTPILTHADGTLYIERESWAPIHLQPYEDLQALIDALKNMNLKRVG
jgi:hypothetical protein